MTENGNGDSWTSWTLARAKPAMELFIERMRKSGNVYLSCQSAGIPRSTAYYWRNKYKWFFGQWHEAKEDAVDKLDAEAWERGTKGKSDRLLMFLLKAHRREVYGDRVTQVVTGSRGGPVEVKHSGGVQVKVYIPDNDRGDRDPTTTGATGEIPE